MRHLLYTHLIRLVPHKTVVSYATRCQSPMMSLLLARTYTYPCIYKQTQTMVLHRFISTAETTSFVSANNIISSPIPDLDIPTNVPFHQFIFEKCDQYKDTLAIEEFLTGKQYTYRQLKEKSIRVASGLHKLGCRKGDVLVIFSPNNVDMTVLMLACAATGMWVSPANPAYTASELARQLSHSEATVLVTASALSNTVKEALGNQEHPNQVKDIFVFGESPGFQPFQKLLEDDGKSFPDVDINPLEDVFALPYSSGTTGLPKGVMLTHYSCLANCMQIFASAPVTPEDWCVGLLPLYHIYGMIVLQYTVLIGGAKISYLPKFEPETFLRCLQERKITMAHLVPPIIVFLTKHPVVSKYDLTSLKKIICGAAPLGADITSDFLQQFTHGIKLNQGYGMTEMSPVSNVDIMCRAGSIGNLVANSKGKIVDTETNKVLGPGEVGEFCVKGPQIMKGYFKNQKATDEMIETDGWLHTGDIGYVDKDGIVYIQDRLKELIKYKGSQVAPAELEALLLGHPCIQDVAVIGLPDANAGELPKAFVVKKSGSNLSEKDVIKFVEGKVAHTKQLRGGVQFIDEIPKNPSGKILRKILRSKYL